MQSNNSSTSLLADIQTYLMSPSKKSSSSGSSASSRSSSSSSSSSSASRSADLLSSSGQRMSTSLDMRLQQDLKSLPPGKVIDVTNIADTKSYRMVDMPDEQDAHVIFHGSKLMALNERDARYTGHILLDDKLASEFLSAEDDKISKSRSKSKASPKASLMIGPSKPGYSLSIKEFDLGKKPSMMPIQPDMVVFYDDKLMAGLDDEDDVKAYASAVAQGDDAVENGILASYYDQSAKQMLGASKVSSSASSASPSYKYSDRSEMSRSMTRSVLSRSPAVADVSSYRLSPTSPVSSALSKSPTKSCGCKHSLASSSSRSPSKMPSGPSRSHATSASVFSQSASPSKGRSLLSSYEDEEPSWHPSRYCATGRMMTKSQARRPVMAEPSFDDELPSRQPPKPSGMMTRSQASRMEPSFDDELPSRQSSSRMMTRSQASRMEPSFDDELPSRQPPKPSGMMTRTQMERNQPVRYSPSEYASRRPAFDQSMKVGPLKPSSVRYSSSKSSNLI